MNARLRLVADRAAAAAPPPVEALHEEPGPDAARCLGLYAKLAAGVAVVTARGDDGPLGMTVSAVTSLTLPFHSTFFLILFFHKYIFFFILCRF